MSGKSEPQVVQGPRGWGDAQFWFDPITYHVKAEAVTWLNGTVKYKHTICSNVIAFEIEGVSQWPDQIPACKSGVIGGASVWDAASAWWACGGSPLFGMRSKHEIYGNGGPYHWGPIEDFEITENCQ